MEKTEAEQQLDESLPKKRRRLVNGSKQIESSFSQSTYLNKFAKQRNLVTNTQKARYLKGLRKVGTINVSEIGKHSNVATIANKFKELK